MQAGSLHDLRPDAFEYAWDNSIEPALEIESGETVLLHVRDASDEQIGADIGRRRRRRRSTSRTSTRSAARSSSRAPSPGDALAVELLEFQPQAWGWTAIIPGFGLLADEFPDPWLRISRGRPSGPRPFLGRRHASVPAVPGHARRRAAGAGAALDRAAVPLRREHGHEAPQPRRDALPARRRRGRALLARRHARRAGRRRGVRDGDRDGDGRRPAPQCAQGRAHRRAAVRRAGRRDRRARAVELPRLHRRRARPDGGAARRRARDDRAGSATRYGLDRAGGLRGRQRRVRSAHPRGRRRPELGRRLLHPANRSSKEGRR